MGPFSRKTKQPELYRAVERNTHAPTKGQANAMERSNRRVLVCCWCSPRKDMRERVRDTGE